jgi:uncharacterized membrane protein YedE/YeeE
VNLGGKGRARCRQSRGSLQRSLKFDSSEALRRLAIFLAATSLSILAIATMRSFQPTQAVCHMAGGNKCTRPHWQEPQEPPHPVPPHTPLSLSSCADLDSDKQGIGAVVVGTFLVGVGMSVAGACPALIWVQLGSGNVGALVVVAGGVIGAWVVSRLEERLGPFLAWKANAGHRAIYQMLGVRQWATAAPLFLSFLALALVVDLLLLHPPDSHRLAVEVTASPIADAGPLSLPRWDAVVAGVFVGCVQVLMTLGARKNLGASTSFTFIAAWLDVTPNAVKARDLADHGWQLVFVVGIAAGSALSAALAGTWYSARLLSVIPWWQQLIGGIVLLLGSRLASGCTTGHGVSGIGHQSLNSLVGVASMFAGGIIARWAFFPAPPDL